MHWTLSLSFHFILLPLQGHNWPQSGDRWTNSPPFNTFHTPHIALFNRLELLHRLHLLMGFCQMYRIWHQLHTMQLLMGWTLWSLETHFDQLALLCLLLHTCSYYLQVKIIFFKEKFPFVHNLLRNDPKSSAPTNIPSDRMFLWPTSKRPPMSAVSTNRFHWQWCCKGCNKKGQFEGSGDQSVLRSEPVGRCPSTRGFRSCCGGDAWELGKLVF